MKTKDRYGRDKWESEPLNYKKPLKIRTNTNYFNPEVTRVVNTFQSPRAYSSRKQKIEGYETRLYWQYRYCEDHDGQSFFYTLTYNDRHMPRFYGQNCFDYEDLRDLLTGGFRKQLLRKYGTAFKYFIGAELGDGKGSRGIANNPHYHIIFFLEDANKPRFPYRKIDPTEFRHLVRLYWQGHDEDTDGWKDYRTFRYGVAKEGENLGVITDFRACMYCAKYVCKDVKLTRFEGKLRKYLATDCFDKYYESDETYRAFYTDYIVPNYEHYTVDERAPWDDDFNDFDAPIDEAGFKTVYHKFAPEADTIDDIKRYIKEYDLASEYTHFCRLYVVPKVEEYIKEYRNRYCNKCRISHGVGDYAFEQPNYDKFSGTIPVPSKKGFKERPINLYYYRKLFTNTEYDPEYGVRYVINDDGVQYKMDKLPKQLEKLQEKACNNLSMVIQDPDLYRSMLLSDVNIECFTPYTDFFADNGYLLNENNLQETLKRYGEYKFIYENRFFADDYDGDTNVHRFPVLNPYDDYRRFISLVVRDRNVFNLNSFFADDCQGYVSYQSHPYFQCYIGIFNLLDLCADYFFIQKDDRDQREAEERASVKRFHDRQKLNDFYSRFVNN